MDHRAQFGRLRLADGPAHVQLGAVVVDQCGHLEDGRHVLCAAAGSEQGKELAPGQLERGQGHRGQRDASQS